MMVILGFSALAGVASGAEPRRAWDELECRPGSDAHQHHDFPEPSNPRLRVHVDLLCDVEDLGEASVLPTDCTSTAFVLTVYRWTSPYSFRVDASKSALDPAGALAALAASALSWDAETNASLVGTVDAGGNGGKAGRLDGISQVGWKRLSARSIALTTTWYSTTTFLAVESDQAYSTNYRWSLAGEASRMDLQNIATHEIGHSFGLSHPASIPENACLTMFATADYGETQKRTPGDGDVLGIRAIYP
jgi:matrixin